MSPRQQRLTKSRSHLRSRYSNYFSQSFNLHHLFFFQTVVTTIISSLHSLTTSISNIDLLKGFPFTFTSFDPFSLYILCVCVYRTFRIGCKGTVLSVSFGINILYYLKSSYRHWYLALWYNTSDGCLDYLVAKSCIGL